MNTRKRWVAGAILGALAGFMMFTPAGAQIEPPKVTEPPKVGDVAAECKGQLAAAFPFAEETHVSLESVLGSIVDDAYQMPAAPKPDSAEVKADLDELVNTDSKIVVRLDTISSLGPIEVTVLKGPTGGWLVDSAIQCQEGGAS